jgi:hypothetical protein
MRTRKQLIYQQILGTPLPTEALMATPMPRALIREFDRRAVRPNGPLLTEVFRRVDESGSSRRWEEQTAEVIHP